MVVIRFVKFYMVKKLKSKVVMYRHLDIFREFINLFKTMNVIDYDDDYEKIDLKSTTTQYLINGNANTFGTYF